MGYPVRCAPSRRREHGDNERVSETPLKSVPRKRSLRAKIGQAFFARSQLRREAGRHEAALFWLRLACDLGHPKAQFELGHCLERGLGVLPDPDKALETYERAAKRGSADAMLALARCYDAGELVDQDDAMATGWLMRGAEKGHADSQYFLWNRQRHGIGTRVDRASSLRWLEAAVAQGHPLAAAVVLGMHLDGIEVQRDDNRIQALMARLPSADEMRQFKAALRSRGPVLVEPTQATTRPPNLPSCYFAFHLLPRWYFHERDRGQPLYLPELQAAVARLWPEAERLAQQALPGGQVSQAPRCEPRSGAQANYLLVLIPGAMRAPDPAMLMLEEQRPDAPLQLAERINDPLFPLAMCQIGADGVHAVRGAALHAQPDEIVEALLQTGEVPLSRDADANALTRQPFFYAEVDHRYRQAQGIAAPTPARVGR
jgi:TPR repeat protein